MAAPLGDRPGGRRNGGGLRRPRLRARRRSAPRASSRGAARRPRTPSIPPMSASRESPPLAGMDIAGRLPRLAGRLAELGCDALLVSKQTNIRYLTGFTGSAGLLLVLSDDALLVTDGRYRDQAADQVEASGAAVRIEIGRPAAQLAAVKRLADGVRRLGLEAEDVTWGSAAALAGGAYRRARSWSRSRTRSRRSASSRTMVSSPGSSGLRHRRRRPRAGQGAPVRGPDRAGVRDRARLRDAPARSGVAPRSRRSSPAGRTRALPHARPTDRVSSQGELVVIDFGATVDGYRSDMTRTFCVGAPASGELQELLEAVLAAQRAGVRAVRPGVTGGDVDAACRDSLDDGRPEGGVPALDRSRCRPRDPRGPVGRRRSPLISCRSAPS